ncbi:MAG: hypothetical protein AAF658_01115 [Myxococcota bacterium]
MLRSLPVIALALALSACGTPSRPPLLSVGVTHTMNGPSLRTAIVQSAERLALRTLEVDGVTFDPDPVGFARAVFWTEEIDLFDAEVAADPNAEGVAIVLESARKRGQLHQDAPRPGDLAFFSDASGAPAMVAVVVDASDTEFDIVGWFRGGPERVRLRAGRRTPLGSLLVDKAAVPIERRLLTFADPF